MNGTNAPGPGSLEYALAEGVLYSEAASGIPAAVLRSISRAATEAAQRWFDENDDHGRRMSTLVALADVIVRMEEPPPVIEAMRTAYLKARGSTPGPGEVG